MFLLGLLAVVQDTVACEHLIQVCGSLSATWTDVSSAGVSWPVVVKVLKQIKWLQLVVLKGKSQFKGSDSLVPLPGS